MAMLHAWAAVLLVAPCVAVVGQPPDSPGPATPPAPPADGQQISIDSLPPQVRLGARVEFARRQLAVTPVVVLVPDAASYVAAIGSWSLASRFPVLIDDGSFTAREDIARFVRAFKPTRVVRWKRPADSAGFPEEPAAREAAVADAVARAWGAADATGLAAQWKHLGFVPPGVVVSSTRDPAWTAALAIAAGRGEPIIWADVPRGGVDHDAPLSEIDSLSAAIEKGLEATGYRWSALGDDIDAVTLCMDVPAKAALPAGDQRERLATTDLVGRSLEGQRGARWAWAGQVFGSEPRAAYRGMCGLFLQPSRAWLFDGYDDSAPWNAFDCTAAATELEKAGIKSMVNDSGRQGIEDFRRSAAGRVRGANADEKDGAYRGGLDCDLVFVNSSGYWDYFDLKPGKGFAGDAPVLAHPAMVHFVHSWSLMRPGQRAGVGGRWIDHGAYAYIGSVHEPFLQAFVPTPLMAKRLLAGFPWGVAGRLDVAPVWKIAVVGDPLITFGPPAKRNESTDVPLEGAANVQDQVAPAIKSRKFADAMTALSLAGRGDDAARLLVSLLSDDASAVDVDVALAGIVPAYLAGRFNETLQAARIIADAGRLDQVPLVRDIVWQTLAPTMSTLRTSEVELIKLSLRPEQIARDAAEAARAIRLVQGPGAARSFADSVRSKMPDDNAKAELDAATH
ncbi:MAG: hypothetical protein KF745_08190 [Phycisphaeraceae bacterium]|nr:hypothetical protein [Phycisphaeraceae bacterium]